MFCFPGDNVDTASFLIYADGSVAVRIWRPLPGMAGIGTAGPVDARLESRMIVLEDGPAAERIAVFVPLPVVHLAPAADEDRVSVTE